MAILCNFVVSTRNYIQFKLDYILMQMRKIKHEKATFKKWPNKDLGPSKLRLRFLKTNLSRWKYIKSFLSALRRRNPETQQSMVILDLCLRKLGRGNHVIRELKQPWRKITTTELSMRGGTGMRTSFSASKWNLNSEDAKGRRPKNIFQARSVFSVDIAYSCQPWSEFYWRRGVCYSGDI